MDERDLKPRVLRWIDEKLRSAQIGGRGGASSPHDLGGPDHAGTLRTDQAPQFLLTSGARPLLGSLAVAPGMTIDGEDISALGTSYRAHIANRDAHHRAFVGLRDASGGVNTPDGADRITISGGSSPVRPIANGSSLFLDLLLAEPSGLRVRNRLLSLDPAIAGDGLRMTGATLHVTPGDGLQVINDAVGLIQPGTLGVSTSNRATSNHTHAISASSNPGAAPWLLRTDVSGNLTLWDLDVRTVGNRTALFIDVDGQTTATAVEVRGAAATGVRSGQGVAVGVRGQAWARSILYTSGALGLGGGAAAPDVVLHRTAAGRALLAGDMQGGARSDLLVAGAARIGDAHVPQALVDIAPGFAGMPQVRLSSTGESHTTTLEQTTSGQLQLTTSGSMVIDARGRDILPARPYETNLGSLQQKFLTLHAAELWVETLVAQQTQATINGRVVVAPSTALAQPLEPADTRMTTRHAGLQVNDVLYLEAAGKVEFLRVTAVLSNLLRNASLEDWPTVNSLGFWSASGGATLEQQTDDVAQGARAVRVR